MANDIRISTSLDTASIRNAEQALRGLITLADKLNKATDKIAQSVSKINTGGTKSSQSTPGSFKSPQSQPQGISGALLGDADKTTRDADKIIRAFDKVEQRASRMSQSVKSADSGWASKAMYEMERKAFVSSGGNPNLPGPLPTTPTLPVPQQTPRQAAGLVQGITQGAEHLVNGNVSGFLGSTLGRAGLVGAAAYGAYRLAGAATNMAHDTYYANQQFQLYNPVAQEQLKAQVFSPLKMLYGAVAANDLGTQRAFIQVQDDKRLKDATQNTALARENVDREMSRDTLAGRAADLKSGIGYGIAKGREYIKSQVTIPGTDHSQMPIGAYMNKEGGGWGGGLIPVQGGLSRAASSVWESFKDFANPMGLLGGPGKVSMSQRDIQEQQARQKAESVIPENEAAAIAAKKAQFAVAEDYFDQQMQYNAMSRVKTMRMMGRSTADVVTKVKIASPKGPGREDTVDVHQTAYEKVTADAALRGYDPGDYGANYQQVLGIGKGYQKIFGNTGIISPAEQGFTNIAQVTKMASMIGGSVGAGGQYRDFMQSTIGDKGLDVAVARDLYQNLAQNSMNSGYLGNDAFNKTSQMVGTMVYGGGLDVAAQSQRAHSYALGNELEKSMSTRSGFDVQASWQNAIKATGGRYNGATLRMQELGAVDPRIIASVAAGAKAPMGMEDLITKQGAQTYLDEARKRDFATVVDENWGGVGMDPERARQLKVMRENGNDPNAAFRDAMSRARGKKGNVLKVGSAEWEEKAHEESMFLAAFKGGNKEALGGLLEEKYMRSEMERLTGPKGPGVGNAAPKGSEAYALQRLNTIYTEFSSAGSTPEARKNLEVKYGAEQVKRSLRAHGQDLGDVGTLSDAFVKAASDLANAIKARTGGKPKVAVP